MHVLVLFFLAV